MILRKPYKFLIKNFKLIHLLLLIPILYLLFATRDINTFFTDYIANNYSYAYIGNLAGSFINVFMYLADLVIIGVVLAIYYLMKQKKKPTKLYSAFIVYYIILFVTLTFCLRVLSSLEITNLTAQTSRAYKGIFFVLFLPQYFFVFLAIFRGLGFDIKSFKFEMDLADLDINEEDNEEFEFVLGVETYKYKKNIRRFIREFRYYVLENKFVFTCLSVIFVLVVGTIIFMNNFIYNQKYSKNSKFSHSAFQINFKDSMITNVDYNGNTITKGKYYLVLKLNITNNSLSNTALDTDNFRLQLGDDKYLVPKPDRSEYFVDFGAPYNGEKILRNSSKTYNIVYELNKNQIKSKYKIKILENIEYGIGELTPHYKILNVNPQKILEKNKAKNYKIGDEIKLKDTLLGDTSIKINKIEIADTYTYKYKVCNNKCVEKYDMITPNYTSSIVKSTFLVLDTKLVKDNFNDYFINLNNINSFYEDFFNIEVGGKKYSTINVTPKNYNEKIILQVPALVKEENANLLILIRNNEYKLKIA